MPPLIVAPLQDAFPRQACEPVAATFDDKDFRAIGHRPAYHFTERAGVISPSGERARETLQRHIYRAGATDVARSASTFHKQDRCSVPAGRLPPATEAVIDEPARPAK